MCRIVLHACGDPGSALLRVWLSDHQATLAAQCRSELRHHLLRDVDASAVLLVPGFRRCRSRLHLWVHQCNVSGWCCGVKIDFHASVLQAPRITEYSQQHVTVPTFFLVSPQNAEGRYRCCGHSRCVLSSSCRNRTSNRPASSQRVSVAVPKS